MEAVLRAIDQRGGMSARFSRLFGPRAEYLARRMVARGSISSDWLVMADGTAMTPIGGAASEPVRTRIASLLQEITIRADLRDGRLRTEELSRVGSHLHLPLTPHTVLLAEALRRLGGLGHPFLEEMEELLRRGIPAIPALTTALPHGTDVSAIRCPLIRLLHLRLILESPSLSSAVASPEQYLVPDVLLWVLGTDAVSYRPSLRVHDPADRRWRARWVETTAEALSLVFMEEVLLGDLTTLSRVPEGDEETPDFQAKTINDEPIVLESKGSTNWATHLRQRGKALGQLGKAAKRGKAKVTAMWAASGRAFACCLYAAKQGADADTLFHVVDPPFAFARLFSEGWEERARRHHYAAVLQAAHQFELAERVVRREPEPFPEEHSREVSRFSVPSSAPHEEAGRFVGIRTSLIQRARELGHPTPREFAGVSMFVGVDERVFDSLYNGQIPGGRSGGNTLDSKQREGGPTLPPVGLLPGREKGEGPRGIYSILSDGAFLAFEVE